MTERTPANTQQANTQQFINSSRVLVPICHANAVQITPSAKSKITIHGNIVENCGLILWKIPPHLYTLRLKKRPTFDLL